MKVKTLLTGIAGGILGIIIVLASVGFIDYLLTSRQKLEPGEGAIIREVWKKEGPLLGPSAPPYQVRTVENNSSESITFIIQPFPFGYVEEVLKKQEVKTFSFDLPLWTKDSITGNPDDASVARVLLGKGKFQVKNLKLYAENLDYRKLPYSREGDLLYPVKEFLKKRGMEIKLTSRERLFSEIVYLNFFQFFSTTVDRWEKSVAQKYTMLAKSIRERNITSTKEKERFIKDFLESYPWYKVEPEHMEKLRENPEVQKLFQKYLEALRSEKHELVASSLKEIQGFFTTYIKENPQAYDEEKWKYVKSILLQPDILPPEYKPQMVYPLLEKNIQDIQENYLQTERENILSTYGTDIFKFQLMIKDDLTTRYPYLLMQR